MTLTVLRETNPLLWGALIKADPDATIFHEPAFLDALIAVYPEFRPHHLVARDPAGRILGALPGIAIERPGLSQLLSLPFGSYGTPLVAAGAEAFTDKATGAPLADIRGSLVDRWFVEASRSGVVRAQLVPFSPRLGDAALGRLPEEWRRGERTHLIPLDEGFEAIWFHRYDKENRTAARKAVRVGVLVAEEEGGAEVLEDLYRRQAREWTGHALYRYGLFRELADRLGEQSRVWVARHHGAPVFAVMAFYHKGTVTPWVSGASPGARAISAGNLIHKVIIEDGCRRGLNTYNFGGSGGVGGIEAFKVAFGGEPIDYHSWFHEARWFGRLRKARRRMLSWLGRE
ncbi:MAG: GNAT family N-acetyltransferase [Candidatus Eisenbacteria bacterium]|nr:GNAT family N-acetyltransferase [Candidatus Eisenbacteria bacterium]